MNAGRAITRAMQVERNLDRLATQHMCIMLAHALSGYYWGWYGLDVAGRTIRANRADMHDWNCPMRRDTAAACSCSLLHHRAPWMLRHAEEAAHHDRPLR